MFANTKLLNLMNMEETMKASEIIQQDLDAIYIGNLNTVDNDLTFPAKGKNGTTFTWESGEDRFITSEGKVHRPLHGMGNRKVTLTVTASYEDEQATKEFVATVLQQTKETIVTSVQPVILSALTGTKAPLPSVIVADTKDGRRMTLPVTWSTYESVDKETVVKVEGAIENTDIKAIAEIHYQKELPTKKGPEKKGYYFPLCQVRLKEGTLYYKYQQLMISYLLDQDDDQMLYNFRQVAGLDTKGAAPMTGWDEESCKLKGHTTGHYLSAIALAWAATSSFSI